MASDRQKIEKARAYIVAKEYQKARAVLVGVDHPTAHKWIAKIDGLDPRPTPPPAPRRIWPVMRLIILAVLVVVLVVMVVQLNQPANPGAAAARQAAHERCTEIADEARNLGGRWSDAYNRCMADAAP